MTEYVTTEHVTTEHVTTEHGMTAHDRTCRRCLLYEMAESAEYRNLYAYIEGLEEEIRAPKDLYEKRLTCCKSCDLLLSGMCRACGCFVELRAAIVTNRCPYEKW